MHNPRSSLSLILALGAFGEWVSASLDPIVIKGSKFFFTTNGTQFFIKGVAYQQGSNDTSEYIDPLTDSATCQRDIPYLQRLGANLISVYQVDSTQDHSECMKALDDAGIYVLSELGDPKSSISRDSPSWDMDLYQRYTSVVDALQNYTNVIGFFAGNEVTNSVNTTAASAFVKAAVRDTKAYIKSKGYRSSLGVGYADNDDQYVTMNLADYFNCGDGTNTIDFWGLNIYSWCGNSNYTGSHYNERTQELANYSVPVFFSEYGCHDIGGAAARNWTEVSALYGNQMNSVFSGGIAYEYFEDDIDYGLVLVEGNSISTLADYNALSTQLHAVTVTGINSAQYTPTNTVRQACPTIGVNWTVIATALPPTPNKPLCDCMMSTLSCQAKNDLSDTIIGSLFGTIYGWNNPAYTNGISFNTTTGVYGEYSMCSNINKLSWAFNAYYQTQGNSGACYFGGNATLVTATTPTASCSSLVNAVTTASGSSPTASTATYTGSPTGSTAKPSSSSSSSTASATKKSSAGHVYAMKPLSLSGLGLGIYVLSLAAIGGRTFLL